MRLLSEEDGAYFRRLWQYWRDRHDNPMVMYAKLRGRRLGHHILNIKMLSITSAIGLCLPFAASITLWRKGSYDYLQWFALLSMAVLAFSLLVPILILRVFSPGRNEKALLSELYLTRTSADEIAFGALWYGLRAYVLLLIPILLGYLIVAILAFSHLSANRGNPYYVWMMWRHGTRVLLWTIGILVGCTWGLLNAARCWLGWTQSWWKALLISTVVTVIWISVGWLLGIIVLSATTTTFRVAYDVTDVVQVAVPMLIVTGVLMILSLVMACRMIRSAGRNAGAKFFRGVSEENLQDASWFANEAAGRLEPLKRRTASRELQRRLHITFGSETIAVILSAVLILLCTWVIRKGLLIPALLVNKESFVLLEASDRQILNGAQTVWAPVALLLLLEWRRCRKQPIAIIAGGLLQTILRLALPIMPPIAILIAIGSYFSMEEPAAGMATHFYILWGAGAIGFLGLQLVLTCSAAVFWLRFHQSRWFLPYAILLTLVTLAMTQADVQMAYPRLLPWPNILFSALPLAGFWIYYLSVFRLWDSLQDIHDRHLRGVPRHTIVEIE
ncbi:hypothetical protein KQI84_01335 [bacterium]|nr:hypothetical protein [bacterium]